MFPAGNTDRHLTSSFRQLVQFAVDGLEIVAHGFAHHFDFFFYVQIYLVLDGLVNLQIFCDGVLSVIFKRDVPVE